MRNKDKVDSCSNDGVDVQPSSLTELEPLVTEFVDKLRALEHEEETLKEHKAELVEEYKTKLDVKTLNQAIRLMKLKDKVQNKDTFDSFVELLERNQ